MYLETDMKLSDTGKRRNKVALRHEKGRNYASINDFLRKNFGMILENGSENIPFLNR